MTVRAAARLALTVALLAGCSDGVRLGSANGPDPSPTSPAPATCAGVITFTASGFPSVTLDRRWPAKLDALVGSTVKVRANGDCGDVVHAAPQTLGILRDTSGSGTEFYAAAPGTVEVEATAPACGLIRPPVPECRGGVVTFGTVTIVVRG